MTSRSRQRADFDRIQSQFSRARQHRDRLRFRSELEQITAAAQPKPARPSPPPAAPTPQTKAADHDAFDQAMRDLLVRVHGRPVPELDDDFEPMPEPIWWSPEVVHGYRVWQLLDTTDGVLLHGAKKPWTTSRMSATCLHRWTDDGPYPHDASECGRPPCGIYALKDPERIRGLARTWFDAEHVITVVAGVVALSGRVIEHETGYRAEHAEAVAIAVISGTSSTVETAWIDQPAAIATVFAEPHRIAELGGTRTRATSDAFLEMFRRFADHTRSRPA